MRMKSGWIPAAFWTYRAKQDGRCIISHFQVRVWRELTFSWCSVLSGVRSAEDSAGHYCLFRTALTANEVSRQLESVNCVLFERCISLPLILKFFLNDEPKNCNCNKDYYLLIQRFHENEILWKNFIPLLLKSLSYDWLWLVDWFSTCTSQVYVNALVLMRYGFYGNSSYIVWRERENKKRPVRKRVFTAAVTCVTTGTTLLKGFQINSN